MHPLRKSGIVVFDMDDTLVDRESVYIKAQTQMLQTLRRLGAREVRPRSSIPTLRRIELELVRLHRGNHMYDYRELGRACWLHFVGHYSETKAAQQAYDENRRAKIVFVPAVAAAAVHDKILENEMPRLFSSCRRVLNRLKRRYFLVLFTSGKKRLQIKVIRHHRFENYFEMIFVRKVKNVSAFRQLKARTINAFSLDVGHRPGRLVMVGDRMSQDIAPASKAGFETIWIPGPYFPGNSNSEKPTCQIKKLRQLPRILLTKDRRNIASISRRNIARRSKGD